VPSLFESYNRIGIKFDKNRVAAITEHILFATLGIPRFGIISRIDFIREDCSVYQEAVRIEQYHTI
jgi:hypothetical protein